MAPCALIAGVGMIPFVKPGANEPYPIMAGQAANLALADAGVSYGQIQQAYVGYVYGDSTCGQRALYELGMTGIPIFNVNNNCSTGSTALYLARQAVETGVVECALALGFEQMAPGALDYAFPDRPAPLERFTQEAELAYPGQGAHGRSSSLAGQGWSTRSNTARGNETFAKISEKARKHARAQRARHLPQACDRRRGARLTSHVWQPDAAAVLPAYVRGGSGRRRVRSVCSPAWTRGQRRHRGAGADHRLPIDL